MTASLPQASSLEDRNIEPQNAQPFLSSNQPSQTPVQNQREDGINLNPVDRLKALRNVTSGGQIPSEASSQQAPAAIRLAELKSQIRNTQQQEPLELSSAIPATVGFQSVGSDLVGSDNVDQFSFAELPTISDQVPMALAPQETLEVKPPEPINPVFGPELPSFPPNANPNSVFQPNQLSQNQPVQPQPALETTLQPQQSKVNLEPKPTSTIAPTSLPQPMIAATRTENRQEAKVSEKQPEVINTVESVFGRITKSLTKSKNGSVTIPKELLDGLSKMRESNQRDVA
jgi:hypothetical protein